MDKGLLNQSLLEKDIEQINYYAKEEKIILNKIYQKLEECSNNYNSTNTNLFLSSINNFKGNIDKIFLKRVQYSTILNKVINKYNTLNNQTIQRFNGDI